LKILVGVGFIRPGSLFLSLEGRGQGEGVTIIDYLIGRVNKKGGQDFAI